MRGTRFFPMGGVGVRGMIESFYYVNLINSNF